MNTINKGLDFLLEDPIPEKKQNQKANPEYNIGDTVNIRTPKGMRVGIVMKSETPIGSDVLVRELSRPYSILYFKSEMNRWNK